MKGYNSQKIKNRRDKLKWKNKMIRQNDYKSK